MFLCTQYFDFGFLGLGRIFLVFSVVGWVLVLMCCASFFLLANREGPAGGYWLMSGLLLNFTLTYAYLFLWKVSFLFFYTTLGQVADIRLNGIILLKGIVLYAVSYMMMCYGIYELARKKEVASSCGEAACPGTTANGENL